MSLNLLLDEDSQAKYLVKLLQASSHNVLTVHEAGISGQPDPDVLDFAKQNQRILLTRNCDDFLILHEVSPDHWGILAIYHDADVSKNMSYQDIVRAIANLEAAEFDFTHQFVVLNQWDY
ncbi:MAG: hypothetical protein F6K16_39585 [Symploca sp. SIO2B6]|nr:hypothetical protein [Symploca sp. SIO2B6]